MLSQKKGEKHWASGNSKNRFKFLEVAINFQDFLCKYLIVYT
jgi:hypothetical protein